MDATRRKLIKAGAAATAMAAVSNVFAQQGGQGAPTGTVFQKGPVRINYMEWGSGFPILGVPGGGMNSLAARLPRQPFDAVKEFSNEFRVIAMDLRNADGGATVGPFEPDRPWDAFADDYLALMDHLGIDKFMMLGFCFGGPMIWKMLERAPNRVVAAVLAQPAGMRPETPTALFDDDMKNWGPAFVKRHPEVTMAQVEAFLTNLLKNGKPTFTVSYDFVRSCQTPVLIMPDDIAPHPYVVANECAMLAPKSELSMYPWKMPAERIPIAVRQVRSFLRAHRPASV